ncbi:MAG TPA: hypothetical protein VIL86_02745 [Tepidisphaeraceae bacterium]
MAKGKHAAALFEVIHRDKRFDRTKGLLPPVLRRPDRGLGRWFPWNALRKPEPLMREIPAPASAPASAHVAPPASIDPPRPASSPHGTETGTHLVSAWPASSPHERLTVDPERHEIAYLLSYTHAIVAAFAVLVIVAIAYVTGRQLNRGPQRLLAEHTTEELRAGKKHPEVLDLSKPSLASNLTHPDASADHRGEATHTWNDVQPPTTFITTDVRRIIGQNYVIVQSYPEEKSATEARDALNKYGVLCTVEKSPFRGDWFAVIGVQGFGRIRDVPEYDAYLKAIQSAGAKYLAANPGARSFKKFEPAPYKWNQTR